MENFKTSITNIWEQKSHPPFLTTVLKIDDGGHERKIGHIYSNLYPNLYPSDSKTGSGSEPMYEIYINYLSVDEEYRGYDYGRLLISHAIQEHLRQCQQISGVYFVVNDRNQEEIIHGKMYEKYTTEQLFSIIHKNKAKLHLIKWYEKMGFKLFKIHKDNIYMRGPISLFITCPSVSLIPDPCNVSFSY